MRLNFLRPNMADVLEPKGWELLSHLMDVHAVPCGSRHAPTVRHEHACDVCREKQNTVYSVGKSIFDGGNRVSVGELMLQRGGGGHPAAGTCKGPTPPPQMHWRRH